MDDPLYDLPTYDGESDYMSASSVAIVGNLVERLPKGGFDLGHMNATNRGVTARIEFPYNSAQDQLDALETVLRLATVVRSLHANLVAARAALAAPHIGRPT
jgi:hypothetical protein